MKNKTSSHIQNIVYLSFFIALIVISSWISIPTPTGIPITLQTFAIFCVAGFLPPKKATAAIIGYILLGAVGLPVFSSFGGGIGQLFGMTGGYIFGFLLTAPTSSFLIRKSNSSSIKIALSMFLGLVLCYFFGAIWFWIFSTNNTNKTAFSVVIVNTVLPYIIPDIIKITLSISILKAFQKLNLNFLHSD